MGRKRSAEHDYVCRVCGNACDHGGTRHYLGRAGERNRCRRAVPMLRRDYDAWMSDMARDAVAAIRARR